MRTFLIDLENVKNQGMIGVEQLSKDDRVFIFYSESANSLSIPTIQAMNNSKAEIEYVKLQRSGRNAMDFQIVALLGFLIGSEKNGHFCIVSQDNGYVAPVEFFMDHPADQLNVNVLLSSSIIKAVRKWNSTGAGVFSEEEEPKAIQTEPAGEVVVVVEETAPDKTAAVHKVQNEKRGPHVNRTVPKTSTPERKAEPAPKQNGAETVSKQDTAERKPVHQSESVSVETEKEIRQVIEAVPKEVQAAVSAEEVPSKKPVEKAAADSQKAADTDKEPKVEEKKPGKRRGRPRKEKTPEVEAKKQEASQDKKKNETSKESQPKPVKKRTPLQSVEVPQDLQERIHAILNGHTDEAQMKHEKVIAQALLTTKAKNEFYQFFRRALGVQAGGDLYRAVRGDYEKLKAASAVSRRSEETD